MYSVFSLLWSSTALWKPLCLAEVQGRKVSAANRDWVRDHFIKLDLYESVESDKPHSSVLEKSPESSQNDSSFKGYGDGWRPWSSDIKLSGSVTKVTSQL